MAEQCLTQGNPRDAEENFKVSDTAQLIPALVFGFGLILVLKNWSCFFFLIYELQDK